MALAAVASTGAVADVPYSVHTEVVVDVRGAVHHDGERSGGWGAELAFRPPSLAFDERRLTLPATEACAPEPVDLRLELTGELVDGRIALQVWSRVRPRGRRSPDADVLRSGRRRLDPDDTALWSAYADERCGRTVLLDLRVSTRTAVDLHRFPRSPTELTVGAAIESLDGGRSLPEQRLALSALDRQPSEQQIPFRTVTPDGSPHREGGVLRLQVLPIVEDDGHTTVHATLEVFHARDETRLSTASTRMTLRRGQRRIWIVGSPVARELGVEGGTLQVTLDATVRR